MGEIFRVKDIMTTEVVFLREEENLEGIEAGMERFHLRHLPVVDGDKLVGLVSHRDILRASVSSLEQAPAGRGAQLMRETFVHSIMTKNPRTVHPETPVANAARILIDEKLGCLPVVLDDGTLVGIVTADDFLKLELKLLGG